MLGFYIKHNQYNRYLGFNKDNLRVWTTQENAYIYFTQLNAEVSIKVIKQDRKYKNAELVIVDRKEIIK